ncbi:hypothetical protein BC826DRAFT_284667 [Russula brevipes]|nr:hypothetical protein BC826DRAFT_284667 [Russula brevipes]
MRYNYNDPTLGTCKETIEGGNHFRYWTQTGDSANRQTAYLAGPFFLAASYELPEQLHHDIIFNGYNLGRDWLIGNATTQSTVIPTSNLTNGTRFSGQTSHDGYVYQTEVQYVSGFITNGSDGINHYLSVARTDECGGRTCSDDECEDLNVPFRVGVDVIVRVYISSEAYWRLILCRASVTEHGRPRGRRISLPQLYSFPCSLLHYSLVRFSRAFVPLPRTDIPGPPTELPTTIYT